MTRDKLIHIISSKDDDWLESRWSVLNEAIIKIEPVLAEVEAAFDHDYTLAPDTLEIDVQQISDLVFDCPECADPVSDRLQTCNHCGAAI